MNRKQKDLHLLSLPVFALMSVCFWVLGGGSGAGAVLTEDSESINTALPVAADRELSGGRLDAMRDAEERESKLRRRLRMQDNSFDWLDAVGQRGEDSTARAAVAGLPMRDFDVPEVNDRPRKPAAAHRQRKEKGRDKRKEEMMRAWIWLLMRTGSWKKVPIRPITLPARPRRNRPLHAGDFTGLEIVSNTMTDI